MGGLVCIVQFAFLNVKAVVVAFNLVLGSSLGLFRDDKTSCGPSFPALTQSHGGDKHIINY